MQDWFKNGSLMPLVSGVHGNGPWYLSLQYAYYTFYITCFVWWPEALAG